MAALEPGRTSWTQVLDAVRLCPDDDVAQVPAVQVRAVVQRLIAAELDATLTATTSSKPMVSTAIWRLRPFTF